MSKPLPSTRDQMPYLDKIGVLSALAIAKSQQDIQRTMEIYHPRVVLETPSFDSVGKGREQVQRHLHGWFTRFPDYSVKLNKVVPVDDGKLASWGYISLTLTGEFSGKRPNGERARVPVFILVDFADGMIVYEQFLFDLASVCRQCGLSADVLMPVGK